MEFFRKWDQTRRFMQTWSHVLNKPLMINFVFCAFLWYFEQVYTWPTKDIFSRSWFTYIIDKYIYNLLL